MMNHGLSYCVLTLTTMSTTPAMLSSSQEDPQVSSTEIVCLDLSYATNTVIYPSPLKYLDDRMNGTPHQAGSSGTSLSLLLSYKSLLNFHAFTRQADASLRTIPAGHSNNINFETSDHFPHLPVKRPVFSKIGSKEDMLLRQAVSTQILPSVGTDHITTHTVDDTRTMLSSRCRGLVTYEASVGYPFSPCTADLVGRCLNMARHDTTRAYLSIGYSPFYLLCHLSPKPRLKHQLAESKHDLCFFARSRLWLPIASHNPVSVSQPGL
ncbi:hypothetical protein DER46DRAFT_63270 [Fusarium sp. MPI-SDFR-AT-0072]|nr:hypothetical protein DER46DRAFT_63270 [Fusarium sp. MPI-SDFR-AT-0072]